MKRQPVESKTATEPATPSWLLGVLSHSAVMNVFTDYLSLPCYVIARQNPDLWYTLATPAAEPSPFQFELYFGKREARFQYNRRCFDQVTQTRRGVLEQYMGLWDYYAPVMQGGKCVAYVVSGSFLRSIPTAESLTRHFTAMAGKSPGLSDPIFTDYTRILLRTPLLTDEALPDFKKLLDMVARMISDEK